jgi:signal transduction histidine kinase
VGLLPFALALFFEGGFAVAVMALDRNNRGLSSNLGYVIAVEAIASAAFLALMGIRAWRRERELAAASAAPLDTDTPQAPSGVEEAWRAYALALKRRALEALETRETEAKEDLETFLASVHALKTPATVLSLMVEKAERDGGGLDLAEVRMELDELDRMLDRVLARLRLDDFERGSRMGPVAGADMVRACVKKHRRLLIARNIAVDIEGDFRTESDPEWLAFILSQLISNAAKYASSAIRVRLSSKARSVAIEIRDDGPGLDAEDVSRLFTRSASGRAGREASRGGGESLPSSSGYGLYLAAEAARRLGASLTLASDGGTVARLEVGLALAPLDDLAKP